VNVIATDAQNGHATARVNIPTAHGVIDIKIVNITIDAARQIRN
jgi:hypothetical protein